MLTLHIIDGAKRGLLDATLSIGILNPHPLGDRLEVYDFGLAKLVNVDVHNVVAVADGDPARVSFAPDLMVQQTQQLRMAANKRGRVVEFPTRRDKAELPTNFVSGYDRFAAGAALRWRQYGVGTQPVLAAGIFSLASVQTSIASALRLFDALGPFVLVDMLPSRKDMRDIVRASGAGLDNPVTGRPAWFAQFFDYRLTVADAINLGERDDVLRKLLAVATPMPLGLGLAKLSFCLALIGNNLGCLDARIVDWAFAPVTAKRFIKRMARKTKKGSYSDMTYRLYRGAELRILKNTPFYDQENPVALARSQWQLWESLGPEATREHSHEELFRAVVMGRLSDFS